MKYALAAAGDLSTLGLFIAGAVGSWLIVEMVKHYARGDERKDPSRHDEVLHRLEMMRRESLDRDKDMARILSKIAARQFDVMDHINSIRRKLRKRPPLD